MNTSNWTEILTAALIVANGMTLAALVIQCSRLGMVKGLLWVAVVVASWAEGLRAGLLERRRARLKFGREVGI